MSMMPLTIVDICFIALTVVSVLIGLLRGASGFLAFAAATAGASVAAIHCWSYTLRISEAAWIRVIVSLVLALLIFAILRAVVKKIVNGLLSQPSDSFFGIVIALLLSVAIVFFASKTDLAKEHSSIAVFASELLKDDSDER